jgi:hypothetical protein
LRLKSIPKLFIILSLILVALSALTLFSYSATIQDSASSVDKTEDLFLLFQKANTTVTEIFSQFEANGKTIPQTSLNEYNQAILLVKESQTLFQADQYSESNNKIIQALQKLKEALRIIYLTYPSGSTEIDLEKAAELESTVSRYQEQLQRIENLTSLAAAAGYNTTTCEANIQTIKSLLDKASSNIEHQRFEEASDNLAEAKTIDSKILNFLANFAVDLKTQRLQTYINQTETRLATIREKAESVSNTFVSPANSLEKVSEDQNDDGIIMILPEQADDKEQLKELAPATPEEAERSIYPLRRRFLMWTNDGVHVMWGIYGNGRFVGTDNLGIRCWGIYGKGIFAGFYNGEFFWGKYDNGAWKAEYLFGLEYCYGSYVLFPSLTITSEGAVSP